MLLKTFLRIVACLPFMLGLSSVDAQRDVNAKVVVSGTVPDEATRAAIVQKLREVYGSDRVVDQIGIGNLVAPPNWKENVQKLLTPELKKISKGQLSIKGTTVEMLGQVDNEAQRQAVVSLMSERLNNQTYTIRNGLVSGGQAQEMVDAALANRIVEFEPGNAKLTPAGQQVLDGLLEVLNKFPGRKYEIVGHTDAQGARASNLLLSAMRAVTVRNYLISKGLPAAGIVTSGAGPDKPIADNTTPEGRARNRRIEFRVLS